MAAAALSPCPDCDQPCGFHFGGKACPGTCSSKTPRQPLQHVGLVWTVAVQTMEVWLGSCPAFSGPQRDWEVTYPKSPLSPYPVSAGSDADKHMQSCVDSQGHKRSELGEALVIPRPACALQITQAERVCELWGLADPTSTSCVTFETYLRRQYKSTAFLRCEKEIKVPTLNRSLSSCSKVFISILDL